VVEYVDTHYRTIPHRDSRGIDGLSMGGYGSMHLALKYPDVFSVVVAQSGNHDWSINWGIPEELTWEAGVTAFIDPQNWDEYREIGIAEQIWYSQAAAFAPNPDNPPFFLDKPHELVDGQPQVVPEVFQKMADKDNMRELDRYLSQSTRLNGIKIVHGKNDNVISIEQARVLSNKLTELDIDHVYEEHGGGHSFSSKRSLPFISEKLSFEMSTNVSTTTWGSIKDQAK
jgi:S-formylglutathione hydrolase